MFTEGSLMKVSNVKEYYGKVIPITIDEKKLYYYGIGFVL